MQTGYPHANTRADSIHMPAVLGPAGHSQQMCNCKGALDCQSSGSTQNILSSSQLLYRMLAAADVLLSPFHLALNYTNEYMYIHLNTTGS